ncbi:hypothetical protein GcM1_174019 [Golovinomyces cichoracearum]|uniref:Uncharacterized protein n=1 Tax=Golovinomyces cichoracearum TaxID=62708 RepID=A0A420J5W4_9PEZI|nr:hypothetical protein GcM1_174019 [Golovinomyces cichoracearum]
MTKKMKTKMGAQEEELRAQKVKIEELTVNNAERKNLISSEDRMHLDREPPQEKTMQDTEVPRHKTVDIKDFSGERSEWIAWRTEA